MIPQNQLQAADFLGWEPRQQKRFHFYKGELFNLFGTFKLHTAIRPALLEAPLTQACYLPNESVTVKVQSHNRNENHWSFSIYFDKEDRMALGRYRLIGIYAPKLRAFGFEG